MQSEAGQKHLKTTLTPRHFTHDPLIVEFAADAWRRAEYRGLPPTPDECAVYDYEWYKDVCAMDEWLQYQIDYLKRPAFMKTE